MAGAAPRAATCACGGGCPLCSGAARGASALRIGKPDDAAEHAAERAATRVAGPSSRSASDGRAKASSSGASSLPTAGAAVGDVLRSAGRPLDASLSRDLGRQLGADFSNVRVHTDALAARSARALRAQAYGVGDHLVFGAGRYAPTTMAGRRLLAHELAHTLEPDAATTVRRYSHEDCAEDDLKDYIWPSDHIAKEMVKKAIRVLGADMVDSSVFKLFDKYFMSPLPDIRKMIAVFQTILDAFDANDYTYECENDCEGKVAYVKAIWSDIHLCTNKLSSKSHRFIASVIVHEFSHKYAGLDDEIYCHEKQCPADLDADDALDNADSFSGFVYDLWPLAV